MNEIHIRKVIEDFMTKLKIEDINAYIQNFNISNNLDVPFIKSVVSGQSKNQFPEVFVYVDDVSFENEDFQKNYNYLVVYNIFFTIALKTNEINKIDLWLNCYLEILFKFLFDFKTENIAYTNFVLYKKEKAEIKDTQILNLGILNIKAFSFI